MEKVWKISWKIFLSLHRDISACTCANLNPKIASCRTGFPATSVAIWHQNMTFKVARPSFEKAAVVREKTETFSSTQAFWRREENGGAHFGTKPSQLGSLGLLCSGADPKCGLYNIWSVGWIKDLWVQHAQHVSGGAWYWFSHRQVRASLNTTV